MNLTVNLCFVLLCTTVSGAILVLCWCLIAWILEMIGKPEYILIMFQVTQLFFLIPLSIGVLLMLESQFHIFHGYFLLVSKVMIEVCNIIVMLWAVGFLWQSLCLLREHISRHRFCKTLLPCEVGKETVFLQVCEKLNIKAGKVGLRQGYGTTTPFLTGLIHPMVVLPIEQYDEQELKIIFMHELNHYRQKDLWVKALNGFVLCIHFFNPAVHLLKRKIALWSEFICDCSCVNELGFVRPYYAVITELMTVGNSGHVPGSGLCESWKELDWRISHMKKYRNGKKLSKWKAVVMGITTWVVSITLIFGTTAYAANLSVDAFQNTQDQAATDETDIPDENVEYTMVGTPDTPGQHIQINPYARDLTQYNWTVNEHSWVDTSYVYVKEGGKIDISGNISPDDQTIRVGIMDTGGNIRYINATDGFYHAFAITTSGYYCIYMENQGSVGVTVAGSYEFK